MSDHLQPGFHPDVDSLNAFIEGVLPEHERAECLVHLAECSRCREIVYLAQEPISDRAPAVSDRAPFWKRWFGPIPVLAAAALACLLVGFAFYRQSLRPAPPPQLSALNAPMSAVMPPEPPPASAPPAAPVPKVVRRVEPKIQPEERLVAPPAPQPADIPAPTASPPPPVPSPQARAAPQALAFSSTGSRALMARPTGISGTVTDPGGAVLSGATVTLQPASGDPVLNTRTDTTGQFNFSGLAPGHYEIRTSMQGFTQASRQIDVQPQEIAKADSMLQLGSAAETVTVEASAAAINTESRAVFGRIAGLANEPAAVSVAKGKITLKADSSGVLYISNNSGKSWKTVKPVWQGKVVRLVTPPDVPAPPKAVFQLATDSGAVWFSRDGSRWTAR
jgi:hypothetical protein